MRYHNTVSVDKKIYDNLRRFVKGKKPENDLFDLINVIINYKHYIKYLNLI